MWRRCKRTKQKRIKLLAMGKLKERLRNQPFDLRLAVLDARIDELKRELKAAKVKWRAAWALRDERFEELDDFEQALLDDGTTGRGRGHPGDGGVRPEMGSHHGVRGGAPEENFGFLNAILSKKHAPNRRTAPRSKALVETCTIPGTHKL